ncbi:alpha/beta hydrolase [Companilactobacillus zhachilii]|jgi:Uncharacterized protein with an alpha/beta hydrolase fold|uniref:Alpha/beta hydrolase n=1 Tax=Companilactobacillus zhachilii TaxID=2304606 RepID=A0A386PR23_9LACO|nr:alpha/beta hydrolase [Companilactobacillus zhachilii]AYE38334.1 alpha/beta hydrolase [Companilactobacillus zhachilii]MBL3529973.1 alpha/beta hydrolase [Companilactobacillus zhachilii]
MRKHNKSNSKRRYLTITSIVILLLIILLYSWTQHKNSISTAKPDPTMAPIIMIPGSDADNNVLDGLINNVNNRYKEHHDVLKVTVSTDNHLSYSGHISSKEKNPYIVVGFENNQDGLENVKKQTAWFNIAFNDLQQKYHFKTFNAFGHSNGSLIWTYFLEDYFQKYQRVQIKHLMTVGAPYNFEEKSHSERTEMLDQLIKNKANLPKSLSYYSIAGTEQYTDDGIVPLSSVDAGKFIYQDQIKHYMFITLTGSNAQHSDMLTNPQFITLFHQFIIKSSEKMAKSTKK